MEVVDGLPSDMDLSRKGLSHLDETQAEQLKDLIRRKIDAFATRYTRPGMAKGVEMNIELVEGAKPVCVPDRPLNPAARLVVISQVEQLLEDGIIEKCYSSWNNPLLLIPKPNGQGTRVVNDFRRLNALTKPLISALPRASDCIDALGQKKWYTQFDLNCAYWTIPLKESDREKTAFIAPGFGSLQYRVAGMGLKNSQAYFCQLMNLVLQGLAWKSVVCYSDDLVIATSSEKFEDHLRDVEAVLDRLIQYGVQLKGRKCRWAVSSLDFLGYRVNAAGVQLSPAKTAAIRDLPLPSSLTELRSFLSSVSAFRRFVPKFAEVSAPLRPLLQDKGFRLPLTAEQVEAIQNLKAAMCDNVVMHHPDWEKMDTFEVHTDGSKRGIGGFLAQRIDGVLKPIRYVSRCTTKAEENYSAHELEVLAALYVIEACRSYLIGTTFKLITDHSSLKWLLDSGASDRCGRQVRWLMRLSTCNPRRGQCARALATSSTQFLFRGQLQPSRGILPVL